MKRSVFLTTLLAACLQDPGPLPAFPTYVAGQRGFTGVPCGNCVFSLDGRYGVVGDGPSVLFLELAHGRVHGTVTLPGQVEHLVSQSGETGIYALTSDSMYRILPGSFQVTARGEAPPEVVAAAFSGGRLYTAGSDGTLWGFHPLTLMPEISESYESGISHMAGTPQYLVTAWGANLAAFSGTDLAPSGSFQAWGEVIHLSAVDPERVCASITQGNEVALFLLPGLNLELLFTVPGSPRASAVAPQGEFAFAATEQGVLVAVGSGGGVEWTARFGDLLDIRLSPDLENALLLGTDTVTLLEK